MAPDQIAKPDTEAAHQMALFAFCAVAAEYGFAKAWQWCETGRMPVKGCSLGVGCDEQGACYAYVHGEPDQCGGAKPVPELKWLHHIPNGGSRGDTERSRAIEGGKLKAQGVKPGVPDVFLPVGRHGCLGLYIEMKKPAQLSAKNGGLSDAQIEFGVFARAQGYGWMPAYSWQEAAQAIEKYLCESA